MPANPELFQSEMVPAHEGSGKLFEERLDAPPQPVTCLGKTFMSDEERRAYFTEELRKKLTDPEFRKIEGFPIGKDEDILALSDPPYYTACPNPWIADFIAEWNRNKLQVISSEDAENLQTQKPETSKLKNLQLTPYHREPFAADVSEGKNDPIYNAHSYHTKVPHKAIMRYILHYTEPGDIVFDGFCGTGMTGVAAQMCGNQSEVESLGYKVEDDGAILQEETDEKGKKYWRAFSKLGARKAVLNDLSPAATFIAYNYNTPVDVAAFEKEAKRILAEVEAECGWMYETMHTDGETKGRINYTVWSEVFSCPYCTGEILFFKEAFDMETKQVLDVFPCPHCGAILEKKLLQRLEESKLDKSLNQVVKSTRREPCLIVYQVGNEKIEKIPDTLDINILEKIKTKEITDFFPTDRMMHISDDIQVWGDKYRAGTASFSHIHHLYTPRAKYVLALIWSKLNSIPNHKIRSFVRFCFEQSISGLSLLNRYGPTHFSQVNRQMSGVYYIASQHSECSPWYILNGKIKRLAQAFIYKWNNSNYAIRTGDSSKLTLKDDSVDYIFIDPPFGDNLAYAELNFVLESFHRVFTNIQSEAIISKYQKKNIGTYYKLMKACLSEFYRILKRGHWMTIEFSNTQTAVWNIIQTALSDVGFIVANVSALDKQQGSYNAVTNSTSVKQDLVISAYKPNGGFEERFIKEATTEEGIWDFIRTHLGYLPVVKIQNKEVLPVDERQPRILFDHVIAYYVRKGIQIPIASSQIFQAGLKEKFDERDGMYFLYEQALEYDKKKMLASGVKQSELFVINEESAIQWLKTILSDKPQAIQDIQPEYMQKLTGFDKKEEKLELKTLLEQNFIEDDAGKWHVPDPENAVHVEKIREKALLREFETYKTVSKKLKIFRIEAVRAGFKKAYQDHDYKTILKVADTLSGDAIEEDPMLLMWYTSAQTRLDKE